MLLFLLVFNLIEINAINTKCKRFYKCPPQSSFYKSFYEFVPDAPDFSKLGGEEQNHVDQFTCGKYCIDVSFALVALVIMFDQTVHKMCSRLTKEILAIAVE